MLRTPENQLMVSAQKRTELPKWKQDAPGKSTAPPGSEQWKMDIKRKRDAKGKSMAASDSKRKTDAKRSQDAKGKSTAPSESEEPKIDIKSILRDIQFLGSSHMTWKEKKDLENRKVVSLGGKPPKKHRLPLSVARVAMKNQKQREEKLLQERAILGRFGGYSSSSANKSDQRRRPEDRILRSTAGNFRNGVLDVQHMLHSSSNQLNNDCSTNAINKGKKRKSGTKGHGKRKGGGKKRR